MIARSAVVGLALLLASPALAAADSDPVPTNGTWGVVFENDLFRETDRDYTGGIAFLWLPRETEPPGWALRAARTLPWFPQRGPVRHVYAFGQNAFTARDISDPDPPLDDRPYAGWLWGTLGIGARTGSRIDQLALTLGVVGPASLAEVTQSAIHSITGSEQPKGWSTQLNNEPGVVVSYQRSWRLLGAAGGAIDVELTPHLGGALGNVYTYANGGLSFRIGRGLARDLGPPRIQPALPGSALFIPGDDPAWYLYVGVDARAVAHNIFLDGNSFHESRSVDKEPLVGDLQAGVAVALSTIRFSYTVVGRSREFTTQQGPDEFGVFTVSLAF